LGGGDAERRVPHDEHFAQVQRLTEQALPALDGRTRQGDAVLGVRAVAAEQKEVVELAAPKLGVSRGFEASGRQSERDARLGELLKQVAYAVEHAIALRGSHEV